VTAQPPPVADTNKAPPAATLNNPPDTGIAARHLWLLLLIQLFWGFNWVAAKLALQDLSPILLTALRFVASTLILLPFIRWHRGQMGMLLTGAFLLGTLHFAAGFIGLAMAKDIAPLAIASNLSVPFATVLAILFLGDRIGAWRFSALALAFGGVAFMAFDPRVLHYPQALALTVLASLLWAVGTLFLRRVTTSSAFDTQGWISLVAFPPLLAWSFLFEPSPLAAIAAAAPTTWVALAFIVGCTTLIGHAGFYFLLRRYSMPQLAPYMLLSPIFAALGGIVWFDDIVTWRMVVGGLITLSGVLIITWREHRPARHRPEYERKVEA
jgi:O-acetylserine/cysteine efflux transporter